MTVFPFQINEVMNVYNKTLKLKPSALLEKELEEPKDVVNISQEAKRRQVVEQARNEALKRIMDVK